MFSFDTLLHPVYFKSMPTVFKVVSLISIMNIKFVKSSIFIKTCRD